MYGHVTWVPDPYLSAANARTLLEAALLFAAVLVVLPLLGWVVWSWLLDGYRRIDAALDEATQELPAVQVHRGGMYVPPDPIAQHADRLAEFAGPTYRYPTITDAEWDTAVHRFNADFDAWRSSR